MKILSDSRIDDGVLEHDIAVGEAPGILWTPPGPGPAPLILLGHPGGLNAMTPRLRTRALDAARAGFASAAIELPGSGGRPPLPGVDQARHDLQRAIRAGEPVSDDVVDRLILPLADAAVPEWRAALDELLALPGLTGPVGIAGGVVSIGVRMAAEDPRVAAAVLFAGSFVPRRILAEARAVTVPVLMLLQWDDEHNDRRAALDLFDALGSAEKTLHANTGGHTGVPRFEGESTNRLFTRHLRR
ncbi:dienelactone hydrolase family protein [Acidipropionibacterium acidipropionici]|uniref:dienelactone hydrolase family protein n=1 Tax=Acidipropionibacterium acidipropionici TaxID=1748 RepID=UPI00042081CC|nr:hypothetical protein [Acidipropionibacterium acidipropionici]ALN14381.1 hypothetical protein ASQ49_02820 [Acidipropionibacterium acidipropionici]APZ09858.1 alpha/beta hydrolase [Acidipropionibacterium acidipropionici]